MMLSAFLVGVMLSSLLLTKKLMVSLSIITQVGFIIAFIGYYVVVNQLAPQSY